MRQLIERITGLRIVVTGYGGPTLVKTAQRSDPLFEAAFTYRSCRALVSQRK